ncbi:MAG: aldo/keto reductase [Pantoea dispersa]|jgi:diketogulonate reductase-like aldo/keto reductase|nr:aldo/keto reductase [Pantoea dispersa]MBZ6392198.1 aldo/keto reductase [Pantoea dispersa]
MKTIQFNDDTPLPAVGQGTWYMGENPAQRAQEIAALQAGLDAGLKLIDTAEMYAEGGAEEVVGAALRGRRDQAWLVSKVYPWNAGEVDAIDACERSLRRLQTDYLDLYLLHWRGNVPLEETVRAMQTLQQQGKIRHWGVSNFDSDDLQELWSEAGGMGCATNQVLYHLASRGIEFDLLPLCQQHHTPVMAYCPLAQAGRLRQALFDDATLQQIAQQKGISIAQLLLSWVIRQPGVMAIPKAGSVAHVQENAAALNITLTSDELALLDRAFPPPQHKLALDVV